VLRALIRKLTFPLVALYWRLAKPKSFGVKALILRGQGESREALLVWHSYGDGKNWNLPGGGYNPKREAPEQAMQRELTEELGITNLLLTWLCEYKTDAQGKQDCVQIFQSTYEGGFRPQDGEISELRWFPLTALVKNTAFYRSIRAAAQAALQVALQQTKLEDDGSRPAPG